VYQPASPAAWYAGAYAAYDAKGAASYAASLLDLTGNGRNLTTGIQPGWVNGTGWVFNRSLHYLKTPIVPVESSTMIIKISAITPSGTRAVCGMVNTSGGAAYYTFYQISSAVRWYNGTGTSYYSAGGTSPFVPGTYAISGKSAYYNGASVGTIAAGSFGAAAYAIYIGCQQTNGNPAQYMPETVTSFYYLDSALPPAQVATISAAMP
jgi:hypothetical protein